MIPFIKVGVEIMPNDKKFSGMELVKMTFKETGKRYYRVFRSEKHDDFVDIDGDTSYEAIEKSKIERPYKIINIIHRLGNFIHKPSLLAKLTKNENSVDLSQDIKIDPVVSSQNEITKETSPADLPSAVSSESEPKN